MSVHENLKKGIAYTLLQSLGFPIIYAISKAITHETTVPVMLFFRGVIGTLLILPWMFQAGKSSFHTSYPKLMLLRSIAVLANTGLVFLSLRWISLIDATLLNNSAPFFIPLIALLWLKIPINHKLWLPMVSGFIGIVIILRPDQHLFNLGALLALGSGIARALTLVSVRQLVGKEEIQTTVFYPFLFNAVSILPFAFFDWHIESPSVVWPLVSIGVVAAMSQYILFKSLQFGRPSHLAPFSYAMVAFSALFDWLFFGIIPHLSVLLGTAFIILSGIWIIRLNKR